MHRRLLEALIALGTDRRKSSQALLRVIFLVGFLLILLPAIIQVVGLVQTICSSALLSGCGRWVLK